MGIERAVSILALSCALLCGGASQRRGSDAVMPLAYGQTEITVPKTIAIKKLSTFEIVKYVFYRRNGGREILSLGFSQRNPPMSRSEASRSRWLCLNGINAWRISAHGIATMMIWRSDTPDSYIWARYPVWSHRAQRLLSTFRRARGYPGPACRRSLPAPYAP